LRGSISIVVLASLSVRFFSNRTSLGRQVHSTRSKVTALNILHGDKGPFFLTLGGQNDHQVTLLYTTPLLRGALLEQAISVIDRSTWFKGRVVITRLLRNQKGRCVTL